MEPVNAYQILKESIEIDSDDQREAYQVTVDQPNEYRIAVAQFYMETAASVEIGQSTLSLGELIRQFYNATHQIVDGVVVDLPGAEFCAELGKVATQALENIGIVNTITEDMAAVKESCDDTVDVSYM